MKQLKLKLIGSGLKLIAPILVLVFAVMAQGTAWLSTTSAWLNSQVSAVSSKVSTGHWVPSTPVQQGYNRQDSVADDPQFPQPPQTELACSGETTNLRAVASLWSHQGYGANDSLVKYQQQVRTPSMSEYQWQVQTTTSNLFTDFINFTQDGLYITRLRAFADLNQNDQLDTTEPVSAWSNLCQLTYDGTPPQAELINRPWADGQGLDITQPLEIEANISDPNLSHYQVTIYNENHEQVATSGLLEPSTEAGSDQTELQDQVIYTWDLPQFATEHQVQGGDQVQIVLQAYDAAQNTTQVKQTLALTQDTQSVLTVTNSPTRRVAQRLTNAGFEQGLTGWDQQQAKVVAHEQINQEQEQPALTAVDQPQLGEQALQLQADGQLTQTIDKLSEVDQGVRSLSFYYRVLARESKQLTQPLFTVYANQQPVYQYRLPARLEAEHYDSQWQQATIYLADIETETINLTIRAQEEQAASHQDQVVLYLDQFSTKDLVVNPEAVFTLGVMRPEFAQHVVYQYQLNGRVRQEQAEPGLQFQLSRTPDDGLLEYWSVNHSGQVEDKNQLQVLVDQQAPTAITDLRAYDENAGDYSLSFTAPSDDHFSQARSYQVRYSRDPITTQTAWEDLQPAQVLLPDNQGQLLPKPAGYTEDLIVTGLSPDTQYYFVVRAVDQAGNLSLRSNVATPQTQVNYEQFTTSPITINEIMYRPNPDQVDPDLQGQEWIELYNQGEVNLDLTGWWLQDESGRKLEINKANSDNNLDYQDQGETVIPAAGWLVIAGSEFPMFNDQGDTVTLFNAQGQVVNSYMYQGSAEPGRTEARLEDGQEHWSLSSVATPGRTNQEEVTALEPLAKLYQSEPYNLKLKLIDVTVYDQAEYLIEYEHQFGEQTVREAIQGKMDLDQRTITLDQIYLATCSSGGICIPHQDVDPDSIQATITLKSQSTTGDESAVGANEESVKSEDLSTVQKNQEDKEIKTSLSGPWDEPVEVESVKDEPVKAEEEVQ